MSGCPKGSILPYRSRHLNFAHPAPCVKASFSLPQAPPRGHDGQAPGMIEDNRQGIANPPRASNPADNEAQSTSAKLALFPYQGKRCQG